MTTSESRTNEIVLGTRIDALDWDRAVQIILRWAAERESRYVCHSNVHSVVTARRDPEFRRVLNCADLVTPDGAPIAWLLRCFGHKNQPRINGPDLMWKLCAAAAHSREKIYLYGASPETLNRLTQRLTEFFPTLVIAGSESPPFVGRTTQIDQQAVDRINDSGAHLVFVSLGCPKQEHWMALHQGHINAVMLGVGAAFDYHAGTLRRAPPWLQRLGLEWLYRLAREPRRLWRRYAVTNFLFVLFLGAHLLRRVTR